MIRKKGLRKAGKTRLKIGPVDRDFSLLVRSLAGWKCEVCGKDMSRNRQHLHCAHYFGRRNRATRWLLENCVAACYTCHRKFHESPHEHYDFMFRRLGAEGYAELLKLANSTYKANLPEIHSAILDQLAKVRAA